MKTLIIGLLILMSSSVWARPLTLDQALEMAQQHSFSLQKAKAQAESSGSDLKAAQADRYPTLSAVGNGNYVSEASKLKIELPMVPPIEREIGTHESYQTDFRLTLPLYTGGRISGSIDLAKASREMYDALESADSDRLAYQTRAEYFGMYRAGEMLKVARASQKRAGVINQNVGSLYAAGAADSVAILDAQLALSRANLGVSQAETNLRVAEIRLLTLIGLSLDNSLELTSTPATPSEQSIQTTVAESKPELRAANASIQMAASRLAITRADYLPTVSAFGGYSYGKPNLDRFGNSWNDFYTFGAQLSWSFNLGGKTANKARALRYSMESAQHEREQVAENLNREANLSAEQLRLAFRRYQNSLAEFQISSAQYRLAEQQHSDGVLTSNRLLEIEADLTAAEAGMAASLVDYYVAQSAYYYATGSENLKKGI